MTGKLPYWLLLAVPATPASYNHQWTAHVAAGREAAQQVAADSACSLEYEVIPGEPTLPLLLGSALLDTRDIQCHHS